MVSVILPSANLSVKLNGTSGRTFIVAFDPLQRLLHLATQESLLQPIQHQAARFEISMYVDDAALFLNPRRQDVRAI
jgi:hypothetical protein